MTEQVLVLPRTDHFGGDWPQGYVPLDPDAGASLAHHWSRTGRFMDRPLAEEDPTFKQPIPYCVLTRGTEVFVVRRRKQGTEGRLHGLYSIGIGGHVGPEDGPEGHPQLLSHGMSRELNEELSGVESIATEARLIGLLNDDSNPVGRVHVGLVYHLEVPPIRKDEETKPVRIREISKLEGGFRRLVEFRDLWQDPDRLETWSLLVSEALFNPPSDGGIPYSSIQIS